MLPRERNKVRLSDAVPGLRSQLVQLGLHVAVKVRVVPGAVHVLGAVAVHLSHMGRANTSSCGTEVIQQGECDGGQCWLDRANEVSSCVEAMQKQ